MYSLEKYVKGAKEALIFDIQRFSIHDGPGIRTTVFFKGCNLRCQWCHNPESISTLPEIGVYPDRCIACGECVKVCKNQARYYSAGKILYDRAKCSLCGACAQVCVADALKIIGKKLSTDRIVREVLKDKRMYEISRGGITCSGGEPLLQVGAVAEILKEVKQQGVCTAVDTAGNVSWKAFEAVLPYTDIFLYDLKHLDDTLHKKYTGVSNKRILENFKKLVKSGAFIVVRIPIIAEVNGDYVEEVANFLSREKNIFLVELLPYHGLGESKYSSLGKKARRFSAPDSIKMKQYEEYFKERGLNVKIG